MFQDAILNALLLGLAVTFILLNRIMMRKASLKKSLNWLLIILSIIVIVLGIAEVVFSWTDSRIFAPYAGVRAGTSAVLLGIGVLCNLYRKK